MLEVKTDTFTQEPVERVPQPTQLTNVYAVLKGTDPQAASRIVLVTGHYDSRVTDVLNFKDPPRAPTMTAAARRELECARVLSKLKFPATIIFLTVAAKSRACSAADTSRKWRSSRAGHRRCAEQ